MAGLSVRSSLRGTPVRASRRASARRAGGGAAAVAPRAAWTLVPVGEGTSDHLDEEAAMPGPVTLGDNKLVVGREASATVTTVMPIPTVSGTHCMIDCVDGQYFVTDLSSTNGTYIDGTELSPGKPALLESGSELIVGDEFLAKFILADVPDEAAAA